MADDTEAMLAELELARERVVAPTIAEKQQRKDALKAMISRIHLWQETGEDKPTAAELRELWGGDLPLFLLPVLASWDGPPDDL